VKALRDELREGFAYSLRPPQWIRGPAVLDGEFVVLEDRQRELYQPHVHSNELLFDLLGLREDHDILGFVRKYGLLVHGPDAKEHRESLKDWWVDAWLLMTTLKLYMDLDALLEGDAPRFDAVRRNELLRAHTGGDEPPVLLDDLERLATGAVAHGITAGLGAVRMRVVGDTENEVGGSPGFYRYFFEPEHLLGHAYAEIAHLVVQRAPLAECPEDGRLFAVEHGRQKFCSPQCAGRARSRRFAEKKRAEGQLEGREHG
jgi:hypothetical protein